MKFLCPTHRYELQNNPVKSLQCWSKWMNEGKSLLENEDYDLALQYFGCAYEVSHFLVSIECFNATTLRRVDRLMLSAHHLAETMGNLGHFDDEESLLISISERIQQFSKQSDYFKLRLSDRVKICTYMLERFYQRNALHNIQASPFKAVDEDEFYPSLANNKNASKISSSSLH